MFSVLLSNSFFLSPIFRNYWTDVFKISTQSAWKILTWWVNIGKSVGKRKWQAAREAPRWKGKGASFKSALWESVTSHLVKPVGFSTTEKIPAAVWELVMHPRTPSTPWALAALPSCWLPVPPCFWPFFVSQTILTLYPSFSWKSLAKSK